MEKPVVSISEWLNKLEPILTTLVPDYENWSAEARDSFAVTMPRELRFAIDQQLVGQLFGVVVHNDEDLEQCLDACTEAQLLDYNKSILPLTGIGNNSFFLNESFGEGETLLDYPTLYDYDLADFEFQETARLRDFPNYQAQTYSGSLYHSWARLFVEDEFYYANLSCLGSGIEVHDD